MKKDDMHPNKLRTVQILQPHDAAVRAKYHEKLVMKNLHYWASENPFI